MSAGEMTEGRRAFGEALRTRTLTALASQLRCTRSAVCQWRAGTRTPNARMRERIRALLGIEPASWDPDEMFTRVNTGSV